MAWRLADCLDALRDEIDDAWPHRSRVSDGSIGDAAHASRDSDHNPWVVDRHGVGVVTAIDVTHDPGGGPDARALAEHLRRRGADGDRRVKYVISDRRIASGSPRSLTGAEPWAWRSYDGSNPHTAHVHVSCSSDPHHYDDRRSWEIGEPMPTAAEIAAAVWQWDEIPAGETPPGSRNTTWTPRTMLAHLELEQDRIKAQLGAMRGSLDRLSQAVAALALDSTDEIDVDQLVADVRAAAEAGAVAALEAGVVDVDVTVRDRTEEPPA